MSQNVSYNRILSELPPNLQGEKEFLIYLEASMQLTNRPITLVISKSETALLAEIEKRYSSRFQSKNTPIMCKEIWTIRIDPVSMDKSNADIPMIFHGNTGSNHASERNILRGPEYWIKKLEVLEQDIRIQKVYAAKREIQNKLDAQNQIVNPKSPTFDDEPIAVRKTVVVR